MYKVIALMGKAGSGKDTLLQSVLTSPYKNRFNEMISCTSRAPRENEVNGKNYFFFSKDEFINKIESHEMLEWTIFNDWYYGTSMDAIRSDKINIGVFNPTGVRSLMANPNIDLEIFYVIAPDKTRLIRQLNREENPDVNEIVRRFTADKFDFDDLSDMKFTILDNGSAVQIPENLQAILAKLDN